MELIYGTPPHSFQGSFFPENHQSPSGNSWVLKRTMVEKIGESTRSLRIWNELRTLLENEEVVAVDAP